MEDRGVRRWGLLRFALLLVALIVTIGAGFWFLSTTVKSQFRGPDPITVAQASLRGLREQNRLSTFAARYVAGGHFEAEPSRPQRGEDADHARHGPLRSRSRQAPAEEPLLGRRQQAPDRPAAAARSNRTRCRSRRHPRVFGRGPADALHRCRDSARRRQSQGRPAGADPPGPRPHAGQAGERGHAPRDRAQLRNAAQGRRPRCQGRGVLPR